MVSTATREDICTFTESFYELCTIVYYYVLLCVIISRALYKYIWVSIQSLVARIERFEVSLALMKPDGHDYVGRV